MSYGALYILREENTISLRRGLFIPVRNCVEHGWGVCGSGTKSKKETISCGSKSVVYLAAASLDHSCTYILCDV